MRAALALLLSMLSTVALTQTLPCPGATAGWSYTYQGSPITSVAYDQPSALLYVVWNATNATGFYPVPFSAIQAFGRSKNPVSTYNSSVKSQYNALLFTQKTNCPILQETGGYIWTDSPAGAPKVRYFLLTQSGVSLNIAPKVSLWLDLEY